MRLILPAFLLLWSAAAFASPPPQVRTGTNTNRDTSQPVYSASNWVSGQTEVQPTDDALARGREMAQCVVSRRPKEVTAALQVSNGEDFRRATQKLDGVLSDCIPSGRKSADVIEFAFAPSALAGLFAEALLNRSGASPLAPAKYDANAPKLDWLAGSTASQVQLRLGECLAMVQPASVSAFVRSAPSSPQELSAFQGLLPAIPACLDKNVTLKATRSSLRGTLAFALYRRSIEPAVAGATAK